MPSLHKSYSSEIHLHYTRATPPKYTFTTQEILLWKKPSLRRATPPKYTFNTQELLLRNTPSLHKSYSSWKKELPSEIHITQELLLRNTPSIHKSYSSEIHLHFTTPSQELLLMKDTPKFITQELLLRNTNTPSLHKSYSSWNTPTHYTRATPPT